MPLAEFAAMAVPSVLSSQRSFRVPFLSSWTVLACAIGAWSCSAGPGDSDSESNAALRRAHPAVTNGNGQSGEAAVITAPACDAGWVSTPFGCVEPWAQWIMPNPVGSAVNPQHFTVSSATVLDDVTGLTWQRSELQAAATWSEANAFCRALELDGEGGWRLPTRIELVSIVDFTRQPAIDGDAFPNTPSSWFWTASPVAAAPDRAWMISFAFGEVVPGTDARLRYEQPLVRCVKGDSEAVDDAYTVSGDTVYDARTQLTWQRTASEVWRLDSADYCANQTSDGGGWRTPSLREFLTLIDETRDAPAFDTRAFPSDPASPWYLVDPLNPNAPSGWMVHASGAAYEDQSAPTALLRCVR